jgi:hypothetical protein
MSGVKRAAVYFVASPLQYLVAKRIAETFEQGARQVLVWYKPGMQTIVNAEEWDACHYMPWPRLEPLPGPFGRHRRLRANIELVAELVGVCDELIIHSAVFDTEAINYFLDALPKACGAQDMYARILPDGLISIRRYPLSLGKRILQHTRKLRRLFAPELNYQCFSGDRIGSDATFCDRIYVLPGLPHEYRSLKVHELPPLVKAIMPPNEVVMSGKNRRALVIGQPLVGAGLLKSSDLSLLTNDIREWLACQGIVDICYKSHPKDLMHELFHPDYRLIKLETALEMHFAHTYYDVVVGVRSSALLFARQIYGDKTQVIAFGWDRIIFKSDVEESDMRNTFMRIGVNFA